MAYVDYLLAFVTGTDEDRAAFKAWATAQDGVSYVTYEKGDDVYRVKMPPKGQYTEAYVTLLNKGGEYGCKAEMYPSRNFGSKSGVSGMTLEDLEFREAK